MVLSMANKKNFTKADEAIDKFFTLKYIGEDIQDSNNIKHANITKNTQITDDTNVGKHTQYTQHNNDTNIPKVTNKSKHYDERGRRAERFGLLIDKQLKEDLKHLSMATGSKSINDFIVTVLLECVERKENQAKLEQYRKLLQGYNA